MVSQVVRSFGIPFALVPLIMLTRRSDIMGRLANHPATTAVAWAVATVIIVLDGALIWLTFA